MGEPPIDVEADPFPEFEYVSYARIIKCGCVVPFEKRFEKHSCVKSITLRPAIGTPR